MTSHSPGPNEHSRRTGAGGAGGEGPSGDRRFQTRIALIGAVGAIIAASVGAVIGLHPWSHPGSSPGGGSRSANIPRGTYSTHVGRALTLTNGTVSVTVELTRIVDPATGNIGPPESGDRFIAAEFKVFDPSAQPVDTLWMFEMSTMVLGSDGQMHPAEMLDTVSECTSFHDGPYQVISDQTVTGCVVFQIPIAVSVRKVQYTFGNELGIWIYP